MLATDLVPVNDVDVIAWTIAFAKENLFKSSLNGVVQKS
jgi:hypothetical protein